MKSLQDLLARFQIAPRLISAARRHHTYAAISRGSNPKLKTAVYFGGGGGVKISCLRPGSGFGFGLGAFFVSFLPLSLFPMQASMT